MRIAQIAPLAEAVPPLCYGGTERIVSYLTEELVALGHDVTLFASGDSRTDARLVPIVPRSLRLADMMRDPNAFHVQMVQQVLARADEFDIIHAHIDYAHLPAFMATRVPHLTTMHGRMDLPELDSLFRHFPEAPLVSISNNQRLPLPMGRFVGTVYHGLPAELLSLHPRHQGYLAFLGRICPEKGLDSAIRIAQRTGRTLRIAAKVDRVDQAYFDSEIRHLLDGPGIEFIGEIGQAEMGEFLGNAAALVFPINWPEPFGLVMIEAMACGTPVIAFPRGSVPEVLEDGVSGFIVPDEDAAVAAVQRLEEIDRHGVRRAFERRFTARRMANDYLRLYADFARRSGREAPAARRLTHLADPVRHLPGNGADGLLG
ncbi:glycosyltransferase family 4 protein [Siccirubricoccus sp. KC 17139]|uniref:Glycosyltransferase family 4 protein n=1 Tax=Siccirubricoccus soli TaxID=2899147 RepID=A0ABT1D264_9PROT|nr:glycosyltransferase family 4 protein [Siccirubricoccus soli]MCO6415996.1 glycosyltransferase family 4 protein [Siccirubricoccus soli]MCP2682128.1 glycosyltransferase family 4 protein [Siccirubricoccus soli]